jgi:hypothetical protein
VSEGVVAVFNVPENWGLQRMASVEANLMLLASINHEFYVAELFLGFCSGCREIVLNLPTVLIGAKS